MNTGRKKKGRKGEGEERRRGRKERKKEEWFCLPDGYIYRSTN